MSEYIVGWKGDRKKLAAAENAVNQMYWSMPPAVADRHPNAWQDMEGWNERYVCATTSLAILRNWFVTYEVREALAEAGFTVIKVTVPAEFVKYGKSGMQAAYDRWFFEEETDMGLSALDSGGIFG